MTACDFPQFNYFSNQISKFADQITNRITTFQIKSLHLKSNRQNGSNRDLNPTGFNLPITAGDPQLTHEDVKDGYKMVLPCLSTSRMTTVSSTDLCSRPEHLENQSTMSSLSETGRDFGT